jgi:prepilin-type N-terminal cleavage/methylation domain-containing protein
VINLIKNRGRRGGFTLVEVLIALGILGIGILGVTLLFPAAMRESRRAGGETIAAIYADSVVDMLRAHGYSGLEGEASNGVNVLRILGRTDLIYQLYDVPQVNVVYQQSAASELYATVVVNVPLRDGRTERYLTYIARQ